MFGNTAIGRGIGWICSLLATLVWHEDGFGGVRLLQVCRGAHLKKGILNNNDDNNTVVHRM